MSNREKRIITVLFLILILSGLLAVRGYGINVDENTEINIARMDLKEYVRLLLGEGSRLFRYMDGMIGDLMDSVEIDHGEAILYPAAALVSILRAVGRADLGMMAYHMYLYICFLFGLLAAYQTGKFLTEKISFGIMAAAFIGLNPLLFGMSFINNKDMVMLSLASVCIFTGIQFVEKKTRVWSVVWAVSAAFCANMRIVGFAYGGLFGLLYLYEFLKSEEKDRKVFINGLLAIGVLCLTFFVITPATWYSIPEYFRYTLTSSAGFLRWHGWELYCGELYRYLEKSLPWHYFFVYFGITTPVVFLAAFLAGQAGCFYLLAVKLRKNWDRLKYMLICMIILWAPMLFFVFRGANVSFRHFFFLYPELVFMAVYVLGLLCRKDVVRRWVFRVTGLQAFVCLWLIIAGHPFQTTYFNILAGKHIDERFEYINTDYYKAALEQILKMDDREEIWISSDNMNCYFGIKQAWEILHPEKKSRIKIAEPETEECEHADYHVYGHSVLIKENMEARQGLSDAVVCEPEKKYDSFLGLDAYGKRVITIYYNE